MRLERLEYGKPCITPDGEVEGGVSPEEYRSLYVSDGFPQHKKNRWNLDTVGTNLLYAEDIGIAHIPFIAKEGKSYHWAGITQIHRIRLENQQTNRPYVISRFGAQVSHSPKHGLQDLLHPFQVCATMLDEPVIGFTRSSRIAAFSVIETELYVEWPEVRKALEFILLGVPIFISLERTEEGIFPSLEEFTSLADAIWAFLPASLRPWFSWAWNVKDFAKTKKPVAGQLMLVAGDKCPANAAEYLGHDQWKEPEHYPEMKKSARRFAQDWLNILEELEGDLEKIAQLSQFFSETSLIEGFGPYSRMVDSPAKLECAEGQGYQMVFFDQLVGKRTEVLPMLQSVFFTMNSIQKARAWFERGGSELQIQLLRQTVAIGEFHEQVIRRYWRHETKVPEDKLLHLSWEYLVERERIKQAPRLEDLTDIAKPVAAFFLKLLSFAENPTYRSARKCFSAFSKLFLEKSRYATTLRSLIEGENALPSLQAPVYLMLNFIAWPYDKIEKNLGLKQFSQIVNIFCLFPKWASDASIRIAVLAEKILDLGGEMKSKDNIVTIEFLDNKLDELLDKTAYPELLKEILEKRPILTAIQSKISTPEQTALAAYLWMTKIEDPDDTISLEEIEWAWSILLGIELMQVKEVVGTSDLGPWFCLARFGLDVTKEQYPEQFEAGKQSVAKRLKLKEATEYPALWPSNNKALINIAEVYFSYYEKGHLDNADAIVQEQIFSRFPQYWSWLLSGSSIMGANTTRNQKWNAPPIGLNAFLEMEKRINTEFLVSKTGESLFQEEMEGLVQFFWQVISMVQLSSSKEKPSSNKKMLSYLRQIHKMVEMGTDPSMYLFIDNNFAKEHYPFVRNLLSHSAKHWQVIKKLWFSYAIVPERDQSAHGQNIFFLLRTYQPTLYAEMPILSAHILNLLQFRREQKYEIFTPLYQQSKDIRTVLNERENDEHTKIRLGVDRLEYLILRPVFLKAHMDLWDERYRGTLLALCFSKTKDSFPDNHFLLWKGFFFEKNNLSHELKLAFKYIQMQGELPIEKSIFLSYYNTKMLKESKEEYIFPNQNGKYGPKYDKRFSYLYSNFDQLTQSKGKVYGIISSENMALVLVVVPLTLIGFTTLFFGTGILASYLNDLDDMALSLLSLMIFYGLTIVLLYNIGRFFLKNVKPETWSITNRMEAAKDKKSSLWNSSNDYQREEYQIKLSKTVYQNIQAIIATVEK